MDEKLILAKEEIAAKMVAIGSRQASAFEMAKIVNEPYDAEVPAPEFIADIFVTDSVGRGEDYEYFVPSVFAKKVNSVVSGSVTQTNVTADAENALTFSDYDSDEEYIYLKAFLEAKYDVVAKKAEAQQESLNRLEMKTVLDLLIAGAVSESNTYAWDSGDTAITPEKIEEMVKSIKKYGSRVVAIAGANVDTDLTFMDWSYNKQREVTLEKLGVDKVYSVETFQYTHSTTQTILDADKLILVATSDAAGNKPGHFVRRKVEVVAMDESVVEKDRLVIMDGPAKMVGANRKVAVSVLTYENFGTVLVNPLCVAVFHNDSSYA